MIDWIYQADERGPVGEPVAHAFPASKEGIRLVLRAPISDDGRSPHEWLRFFNGDLALVVWPRGGTYEALEQIVAADYVNAQTT